MVIQIGYRDLITLSDGTLVSCSQDKTIKFWNINDGQCIKTLNGHTESCSLFTFIIKWSIS
jgi:WD40 repeat protein